MDELKTEQTVRLECLITAFEHYNCMLENGIVPEQTPYEISEQMYDYIMNRRIPQINYN